MSEAPRRPLPSPPQESQAFWAAARGHRLSIQHCNACGQAWSPPSQLCTHCLSADSKWIDAAGRGTIFSFVVVHRVYHPWFANKVPYAVAVVELEEGPRLLTNITGVDPAALRCGMSVTVTFEDVSADLSIPKFTATPSA